MTGVSASSRGRRPGAAREGLPAYAPAPFEGRRHVSGSLQNEPRGLPPHPLGSPARRARVRHRLRLALRATGGDAAGGLRSGRRDSLAPRLVLPPRLRGGVGPGQTHRHPAHPRSHGTRSACLTAAAPATPAREAPVHPHAVLPLRPEELRLGRSLAASGEPSRGAPGSHRAHGRIAQRPLRLVRARAAGHGPAHSGGHLAAALDRRRRHRAPGGHPGLPPRAARHAVDP